MSALNRKFAPAVIVLAALGGCSNTSGGQAATANGGTQPLSEQASDSPRSIDAKSYCAKLQPAVQAKIKIPLSQFKVDDSKSDDSNADDPTYVSCIYASGAKRVTVIARAATDMMERDQRNGLTPLAGYGDRAFYSGEKGGQLRWVDAVRGSDSCEALLGVEQTDLANGDFGKTGGEICVDAFAAR